MEFETVDGESACWYSPVITTFGAVDSSCAVVSKGFSNSVTGKHTCDCRTKVKSQIGGSLKKDEGDIAGWCRWSPFDGES